MTEKPKFQIQMKGANVEPEMVRAGDLAALLVHLEGAIVETAKSQDIPYAHDPDAVLVSLVDVEKGSSNDLMMAVAYPVSPAVSVITRAIATRRFEVLPIKAQEHLHEISKHAIRNRWAYEFQPTDGLDIFHAVISYEFPVPKPTVTTTSGSATLWGHLIRIGGREPKAVLRLRNGELYPVTVTEKLAVELAVFLYRDIGLKGIATWHISDWSMREFRATGIADYRVGEEIDLNRTFHDLADASQGRWEDVDPIEYVKNLRNDDNP